MRIVTAGNDFVDIDAYASAIALAELFRLQGENALAAGTAPINASVTPALRKLNVQYDSHFTPSPNDVFTIVDRSDPTCLDLGANAENVVSVVDHHPGHKDYWKEKLGDEARIETIGAACTQVYELWRQADLEEKMSQNSATLLACGILENTLNLTANITDQRDKLAYAQLAAYAKLPDDWPERYFTDYQNYILEDLEKAIKNDTKTLCYPSLPHDIRVGQLALWDAKDFLASSMGTFQDVLGDKHIPWYMNLIDIHSGESVFVCRDQTLKRWLAQLLHVTFAGDTATADRMWLRKEIMQRAMQQ